MEGLLASVRMADFFGGIVQQVLAALAATALLAVGGLLLVRWRRKRMPLRPNDKITVVLARLEGDDGNISRQTLSRSALLLRGKKTRSHKHTLLLLKRWISLLNLFPTWVLQLRHMPLPACRVR